MLGVIAALTGVLGVAPVRAQPERAWVVAIASNEGEDASTARRAAERAEAHLADRGQTVIRARSLAARVAERVSAAPAPAPEGLRDRVVSSVEGAMLLIADGDRAEARALIEPILRDADAALVPLGRDDAVSVALANLCLLLARVDHETGNAAGAAQRVDACVRRVVSVDPARLTYRDGPMHPAMIRNALAERLSRLRAEGPFLSVEAPAAEGRDCTVRVNGRPIAQSVPARVGVPPGRYGVQVECADRAGRVHAVTVGAEGARVSVDVALDEALSDRETLELVYTSADVRESRMPGDCATLAARLGVTNVLLVSTSTESALRVESCGAEASREPLTVSLEAGSAMPTAIDALLGRRSEADTSADREGGGSGRLVIAAAAWLVGAAALGLATYSLIRDGDCTEHDGSACSAYFRAQSPEVWLWLAGGAASVGFGFAWYFVLGAPDGEAETDLRAFTLGMTGSF